MLVSPLTIALAAQAAEPIALDRATVPATGRQEAIATVDRYGRYALFAESSQGTSVQLVDRMSGPGGTSGTPGVSNGRLDTFLDRGTYKLVATSHPEGAGDATLHARAFTELSGERPRQLVEHKLISEPLGDFEQRSWWVVVDERRDVALEAAGRHLSDLRLWKDGSWLLDAPPTCREIEPVEGKPLMDCQLATTLEPGLYLLTAYGGPSRAWAETSPEQPFHLRWGVPTLPEAGRARHEVSPFGTDRYVVPDATYFRLELPESVPASLGVRGWDPKQPFRTDGTVSRITKENRLPFTEVDTSGSGLRLVTVTGTAGQPYVLQHFRSGAYGVRGNGEHFVATVHAGHLGDAADATALLLDGANRQVPMRTSFVPLDRKRGYQRQFNLLGRNSLYLDVKEAGVYDIALSGTEAKFRVEPLVIDKPRGYEPPHFVTGPIRLELTEGYWEITLEPTEKGIADLVIRPGGMGQDVLGVVGLDTKAAASPVLPNAQWTDVSLDPKRSYSVHLGRQPEVRVGLVNRPLPLDLTAPLPLSVLPGREVAVRATMTTRGAIVAVTEDGAEAEVALDQGEFGPLQWADPGDHVVKVRNRGAETIVVSLAFEPYDTRPETPLPTLPNTALALLPEFDVLSDGAPRFTDLDREERRTWLLDVDAPAFYRVETTGLLATAGTIRTRIVTSFASAEQNGVGRNFLVATYLREGDYQVTAQPQGLSRGHLGIQLTKTPIRDGGALEDGIPARIALGPHEGVVYTFAIADEGDYRLRSFGPNGSFRVRLEDADGWPLTTPDIPGDLTWHFRPGSYRLVVLPEADATRRLTLLERVPAPIAYGGHGPHPLPLDRAVEHTWWEPPKGEKRDPDVWTFTMTADADASIDVSGEMTGELVLADGRREKLVAGRAWTGRIPMGTHRLELVNARRNSGVTYAVAVHPGPLVPGIARDVRAPEEVRVAVGQDGEVELSSFGSTDVRATLWDPEGRVVATSDDRPEDWNFLVQRRLPKGEYVLRVDPVGATSATTRVRMGAPSEVAGEELAMASVRRFDPGTAVHVFPLNAPSDGLLVVSGRSTESVGFAVERLVDGDWRTVASETGHEPRVEVRLAAADGWRLRVWSLDQRHQALWMRVDAVTPTKASEAGLRSGLALASPTGPAPTMGAVAMRLDEPGTFALASTDVQWCPVPGEGCRPVPGWLVPADDELWLVADAGDRKRASVAARRLVLAPGSEARLSLQARAGTPAPTEGPVAAEGPVAPGVSPGVAAIDLDHRAGGPVVAIATGTNQPGVVVVERRDEAAPSGRMAASPGVAVGVALTPVAPVAVAFAADGATEVRVRQVGFAPTPATPADWGVIEAELAPGAARAFTLPQGGRDLRLALSDGLVAATSQGTEVVTVHHAAGGHREERVEMAPEGVVVLNPTDRPARFTLEVAPHVGAAASLAYGFPLERVTTGSGVLRVPVAGTEGATLHVRGADAELVTADGRVLRGRDLPVPSGTATLLLRHDPGLVVAWMDRPGDEARALWGQGTPAGKPRTVDATDAIALEGAVQEVRFDAPSTGLLQLRTAAPVVAVTRAAGGGWDVTPSRAGAIDLVVPEGAVEASLRGVAGAPLHGRLDVQFVPAVPIDEGLGPEVVLPSGGARAFSFTVTEAGPIGLGVRADADVVEASLYDANGRHLGDGVVQMPTLDPGTYVLVLKLPADAAPVRARPALAGVRRPDTGPPDDVVRRYLELAGRTPAEDAP